EEIEEIINGMIPENIRKATIKWVGILETWCSEVGYNYSIESIVNKDQLEYKMIEFIFGNKKEFAKLWNALNGKMKLLKKNGIVSWHHDYLTDEELKIIFQYNEVSSNTLQGLLYRIFIWCCLLFQPHGGEHYKITISQFTFTSNGGIHFAKNYQKNNQGGIDGNSETHMIFIPPDTKGSQGPIYDFKLYFSKRPPNSKCILLYLQINKEAKDLQTDLWYYDAQLGEKVFQMLLKTICTTVGINVKNHDIINHSVNPHIAFMPAYLKKQKENALSLLINNVGKLPPSSNSNNLKTSNNSEISNNLEVSNELEASSKLEASNESEALNESEASNESEALNESEASNESEALNNTEVSSKLRAKRSSSCPVYSMLSTALSSRSSVFRPFHAPF
ncbi:32095_t:CDS:2, partial [Gigaspora margarita]